MKPVADPMSRLAEALQRLPGIGAKTAQRLAFHILKMPREEVEALASSLSALRSQITFCAICCNVTEADPCPLCEDSGRDRTKICVVEEPASVAVLEKTGRFRGLYHVLHGALSPMHGVGPEQLRIAELMRRLGPVAGVAEVIMATNPNVDGEATAAYLSRLIAPIGIVVTRIGMGLPVGSEIDYADNVTLSRALEGRRAI